MAADSAVSDGENFFEFTTQKIYRLPTGALFGAAGDSDCRAIIELLSKVRSPAKLPAARVIAKTRVSFQGILVFKNGQVWCVAGGVSSKREGFYGEVIRCGYPYAAVGSGKNVALGALAVGATAVKACQAACRHQGNCRPPIHTLNLYEKD